MEKRQDNFGLIRGIFWPIHGHEVKKLFLLSLMFFSALFCQQVLLLLKTGVFNPHVYGGHSMSPSLLATFFPIIGNILFIILYFKMSNALPFRSLFYRTLMLLMGLFLIWGVVYVAEGVLNLDQSSLRAWIYESFRFLASLSITVTTLVLFWQVANEITNVSQAQRLYPLILLVGILLATLARGVPSLVIKHFGTPFQNLGLNVFDAKLALHLFLVFIGYAFFAYCFSLIVADLKKTPRENKAKSLLENNIFEKLPIWRSLARIFSSRYLIFLMIVVICSAAVVGLMEVLYKNSLTHFFSGKENMVPFYQRNLWVSYGLIILFYMSSLAFLRVKGWAFSVMASPILIFLASLGMLYFFTQIDPQGVNEEMLISMIFFFYTFIKINYNSLFKATKEISFITLSNEMRIKGKVIIDFMMLPVGQLITGMVMSTFISFFAPQSRTPYLDITMQIGIYLCIVVCIWLYAAHHLTKEFKKKRVGEAALKQLKQ